MCKVKCLIKLTSVEEMLSLFQPFYFFFKVSLLWFSSFCKNDGCKEMEPLSISKSPSVHTSYHDVLNYKWLAPWTIGEKKLRKNKKQFVFLALFISILRTKENATNFAVVIMFMGSSYPFHQVMAFVYGLIMQCNARQRFLFFYYRCKTGIFVGS